MRNNITSTALTQTQYYRNELSKNYDTQRKLLKKIADTQKAYLEHIYKNTRLGLEVARKKANAKDYKEDYKSLSKQFLYLVDLISQLELLKEVREKLIKEKSDYYVKLREQSNQSNNSN